LSINSAASDSASLSGLNPADRARRNATLQLSDLTSSLNTKEDLTYAQSQTVDALLSSALEIKRETNPVRQASLASDASALITSTNSQISSAVSQDSTLSQDTVLQISVDSSTPVGTSSGDFVIGVDKISSLTDLGVSSSLSFDSSDIDATISTLEAAQSSLLSKLAGYSSSRSAIAAEVSSRGESAGLRASNTESIDQLASRLAQNISSSLGSLLASSRVSELDVNSLISESDGTSNSSSSDVSA